jgi:16S rRNA (adenine1518-N6/adenine1519-N6)-dimethyltransferase
MAQTKKEIQEILQTSGSDGPRHRFGQNFMIDQNLVRLVADAGDLKPGELVVEVGPGTGTLTEELLKTGADVLAVEIDRDLAGALRDRFAGNEKFRLIEGDALAGKHEINPELSAALHEAIGRGVKCKLVANLPYNIASPLVVELLREGVDLLAFTVQKEVGDRLKGKADTDDYGPLTVMVQMLGRVEVMRVLPAQAFWPAPKIESSLVRVLRDDRLGADARPFGQFIAKLFSARRKTLRKGLTQAGYDAEKILATAAIDGTLRVEVIPPDQLSRLWQAARANPRV